MVGHYFLLCVTSALFGSHVVLSLTTEVVVDVRAQIRQMIIDEPIEEGRDENDQAMIGGLVRLAFHDCVGNQCDGCINPDNKENSGLQVYIDRAELLYENLEVNGEPVVMSRADFWALAGTEAVAFSAEKARSPTPNIEFRYGRIDCATSPVTSEVHEFPSALGDTEHVLQFFSDHFGFDAKETTAILGAHTLGNAHREASGFIRPWVPRKSHLENQFYIELGDSANNWTQRSINHNGNDQWFWESTGEKKLLMLNSDMCLIKDMSSRDSEGMVNCDFNTCATPEGETAGWVDSFANDNDLWITEFSHVFEKMIEHGRDDLSSLDDESDEDDEDDLLPDITSRCTNNRIRNPDMSSTTGYKRNRKISVVTENAFDSGAMFLYSPRGKQVGFFQRFRFKRRERVTDFIASLWSRLQVPFSSPKSDGYSLQVKIQFFGAGRETITEQFDPSADWHRSVIQYSSANNIKVLDVWAKATERAWFDEMALLIDPAACETS